MVRNSRIEYEGSMYYFKSDGTPMKNRLTYHPDGEHIIYLDANGAMEQQGLFRLRQWKGFRVCKCRWNPDAFRVFIRPIWKNSFFSLEWNDSKGIDFGW